MITPDYITDFLKQDEKALEIYQNLPPSHKREYIRWVESAKQEKTKRHRLEKMLSMLLNGEK